jgi:citrate synthase
MPTLDQWRTGITRVQDGSISYRGLLPIEQAMGESSISAVIWLLLRGFLPSAAEEDVMRRAVIAAADHGIAAPSIAVARICASTRGAPGVAVASGLLAFAGPAHGGAAQACAELLHDLAAAGEGAIDRYIDECRARKIRTPGFGHPVHTIDPRTAPLMTTPGIGNRRFRDLAVELGDSLARRLGRPLPMNGDAALAAVLLDAGFSPLQIGIVGLIGRTIGLAAHVVEEIQNEAPFRAPSLGSIKFDAGSESK